MSSRFIDKDYMLRCSERTLQTNERGFFLQFADHVSEVAGSQWIKNVFGKLKTDNERIRIIYQFKPVKDAVCETISHVQEIYRKKNAELSHKRRIEAEILLEKQENEKALILACQSVIRAPLTGENPKFDDGFTLSLALWSRSKILIDLKKFTWALLDIQAALKEGIPDHLKAEAFLKMAICYKGRGENDRAKISFALAEKLVQGDFQKMKAIEECKIKNFVEDKCVDRRVLPTVAEGQHPQFPNASSKVGVTEEQGKGRFVVANVDVRTGDTIVVEAPYVACLLPDHFSTHCHHCFERLVAPVGCPECANVAFCKAECRDLALSTYHKYECRFLDLLIGSGMSILCHAALRMITQTTLQNCMNMLKDKKDNVHSLCTNSHLRPPEDFFQRTLMVSFLLRCLQKSGYFQDGQANEEVIPNEEEYCIGELLLFYLQILQFNAHEIYETKHEPEHRFKTAKTLYIGVALYLTASLFNHDCYPAVIRHFVGKNIVITAVRPLKPGEAISENYGPIFTRKNLENRQKALSSRYWFQCQCQACKQNWPSYDNGLQNVNRRLKCPNQKCTNTFAFPINKEKLTCPRCKRNISLKDSVLLMKMIEEQYHGANEAMDSQDPQKAISLLCEAIDSYHRISNPPDNDTHVAQEVLRACLADYGNIFEGFVTK